MSKWWKLGSVVAMFIVVGFSGVSRGEEIQTDMSKGGITFSSGYNSLTIGARAQFRYTMDDREQFDADSAGAPGAGEEDGPSGAFAVQRMRVTLKGGMFRPWFKYEFQFEFANTSGTNDNKIKDADFEFEIHHMAMLKVGQYKAPFSLQELTSSGRQEFVDRAITNTKFAPGRDQGVTVNGLTENKKIGYGAGLFNGGGEGRGQDDQGFLYVARVYWDPLGEYKLFESANDAPEKNVLHFGLGARTGEAIRGTDAPTGSTIFESPDNETAYNVEFAWRFKRYFATAEYFMMTDEQSISVPVLDPNGVQIGTTLTSGPDVDSSGYHVQAGVMIRPKVMEVGLRYAQIDPDDDLIEDKLIEKRAVFGYYFQSHNLKVQADLGTLQYESSFSSLSDVARRGLTDPVFADRLTGAGREYTDWQGRVQMQVAF